MSRTKLTQNSIAAGAINANTMFAADVVGPHAIANTSTYSVNELLVGGTILLDNTGNIQINNGGTIGSTGDADAITIASNGVITMNQIPVLSAGLNVSGGSIAGTLSTAAQGNITSVGTLTSFRSTGIDDNADALAITIDSSENVGIGTASPISKLTSEGDISIGSTVTSDNGDLGEINFWNRTNAGSGSGTSFVNDVAAIQGQMEGTGNNSGGSLHFYTKEDGESKTERMRIEGSGQIRISGATDADAESLIDLGSGENSGFTRKLLLVNTGNSRAGLGAASNELRVFYADDQNIRFKTLTRDGNFTVSEKMVLMSDGKLGIGTSAPASIGHIVSDTNELRVENTGTDQWDSGRIRLKGPASANRSTQIIHGNTAADSGASTRFAIELANASDAWVSTIAQYDYSTRFWAFTTGTGAGSERLRIITSGEVGIGTTTPKRHLHVSGAGYEMTLSNTSMSTDRKNMNWYLSGDKAYWRMLNDAGNAGGGGIELDWSGNLKADGYSYGDNGTVQTVINRPNTTASNNSVNAYAEVSTDYRVQITPHHSDSNIHGMFQIPINPTGAANILFFLTPWVSTDGGTNKTVLTGGVNSGARINNSSSSIRSGNGYDANDMQTHIVHFYYDCSATTQLTFGFYNRSEGTNTVYFNHSNTDNGNWGWTAPMYLELKEIRP